MNTLDSVADIAAIDALAELVEAVKARPVGSNAGFGCFYGGSGMGKTTAIQAVKSRYAQGEIMVAEGQEYWKSASAKAMLRGLLKGLDYVAPVSWTIDRLQDEVVCQVLAQDCVLIIDEADMACGGGRIQRLEVLRNIHDALGVAAKIILVGEEKLPLKIREIERVNNRVGAWTPIPKINVEDIRKLTEKAGVCIDEQVLLELAVLHRFRIRTFVTAIERIRVWSIENGVEKILENHWDIIPKTSVPTIRMDVA